MYKDSEELQKWEESLLDKAHHRFINTKLNRKNPRSEKQRDFRKSKSPCNGERFDKECRAVQRYTNKKRRMFLKENLCNEAYYNVRERDFRTYGWITW